MPAKNEEENMKLISAFELVGRSESELSGLFVKASQNLARSNYGTTERLNALGSLENIAHARAVRLATG